MNPLLFAPPCCIEIGGHEHLPSITTLPFIGDTRLGEGSLSMLHNSGKGVCACAWCATGEGEGLKPGKIGTTQEVNEL